MSIIFEDAQPIHTYSNNVGCMHMDHNPPMNIVIPYGKVMVHTCPLCYQVKRIGSDVIRY